MPQNKIPEECRPGRGCFQCKLPPNSCPDTGARSCTKEETEMLQCSGLWSINAKRALSQKK